ncbi:hypothetical protein BD626DRAFT_508278 [Schizophyllum amplum]|uniref:BTB domain-containing protein n=1 Tax=Schizophyllum amplum TaxID=97359 RepID=A0A550C3R0_9AGAR|nr:hypothetical protein BD626DRAFT_508278 [Auriculariopsis ampla]
MASSHTRDTDLWFNDGNLVIQVAPRLFRVHRGVLAISSNFFSDMLAFPESETQEMYEGYFLPPPARTTFPVIEGVLRLAHKYDVPVLRRCALEHLSLVFPTDLSKFTQELYIETNLYVATVAHEVGATWLLPAVYHATLQFDATELDASHLWCGRRRRFTYEDLLACFSGCGALRTKVPFFIFTATNLGCGRQDCLIARLRSFTSRLTAQSARLPCRAAYRAWLNDTWRCFPSFFKLPSWDTLLYLERRDLQDRSEDPVTGHIGNEGMSEE